jgi:uncharacterized membrane protein HdeD (DUF308 family)
MNYKMRATTNSASAGVAQGILAILFGIAALFWPGLTLKTLVVLFSAFVVAWGIAEIIKALASIESFFGSWWLSLIFGLFGLGVGVYLIRHPAVSFATFILLIGFVLIVRGVFDIVSAFFDDWSPTGKVLGVIAGIISVIAGIFILNQPVEGGVAFVWVLGFYSLVVGPIAIALSLEAKKALNDIVIR